jgi:hypothetical protein
MFLNRPETMSLLDEIATHARDSFDIMQRESWDGLCSVVRRSWELNCALDSGTNPPAVQDILNRVSDWTAAAKLPGAGGGGYILLLAKDAEAASRIRHELTDGHVAEAARLLGYPYELSGTVVHGKQLGRTLGFPTANLAWPEPLKLIPALGIYLAWAHAGGVRYPALVSIGRNPTVTEAGPVTVEAYLLDFSGDLYGQPFRLQFIDRLRGEVKFDSVESLVAQMQQDEIQARELFSALR